MDMRKLKEEKQNERDRRVLKIIENPVQSQADEFNVNASPMAALVRKHRDRIRIEFC